VKVGVIGVGAVGVATVLSLIERGGMCREIVLVDRTPERANGVATDRSDPKDGSGCWRPTRRSTPRLCPRSWRRHRGQC
jgi:malate/lactate dehydrogenase